MGYDPNTQLFFGYNYNFNEYIENDFIVFNTEVSITGAFSDGCNDYFLCVVESCTSRDWDDNDDEFDITPILNGQQQSVKNKWIEQLRKAWDNIDCIDNKPEFDENRCMWLCTCDYY